MKLTAPKEMIRINVLMTLILKPLSSPIHANLVHRSNIFTLYLPPTTPSKNISTEYKVLLTSRRMALFRERSVWFYCTRTSITTPKTLFLNESCKQKQRYQPQCYVINPVSTMTTFRATWTSQKKRGLDGAPGYPGAPGKDGYPGNSYVEPASPSYVPGAPSLVDNYKLPVISY